MASFLETGFGYVDCLGKYQCFGCPGYLVRMPAPEPSHWCITPAVIPQGPPARGWVSDRPWPRT